SGLSKDSFIKSSGLYFVLLFELTSICHKLRVLAQSHSHFSKSRLCLFFTLISSRLHSNQLRLINSSTVKPHSVTANATISSMSQVPAPPAGLSGLGLHKLQRRLLWLPRFDPDLNDRSSYKLLRNVVLPFCTVLQIVPLRNSINSG